MTRTRAAKNLCSYQGDGGSVATGASSAGGFAGGGVVSHVVGFRRDSWAAHHVFACSTTPAGVVERVNAS